MKAKEMHSKKSQRENEYQKEIEILGVLWVIGYL